MTECDTHISALYDDEANASMINDEINNVVKEIQNNIIISKLPNHLKAIMNSWIRTHSWYNEDKMSKFELCLQNIVTKEMKSRVIDLLKIRDNEYGLGRSVNEDDLHFVLRRVYYQLASTWFWDMEAELTAEAERWVISNGECLMDRDFERPFSWFSAKTMSTQYHLPHVHRHRNNIDVVSLEVLAIDFKHEPEWTCSICLAVDAVDSRCVRTACKHIFHMGCLDDCKRVFLQQEENHNKICAPCPLCRAPIY
jgi:hypothetical protein